MQKTTFKIAKMDCPSEEQIIRMKLVELNTIKSMEFNLPERLLQVVHEGNIDSIYEKLSVLDFDTSILSTEPFDDNLPQTDRAAERKTLRIVLAINFSFFILEIVTGFISRSMGLVADSLDMLADAAVYGMALMAVGGTVLKKKNIAKFAGLFQFGLALIGFAEVFRRFVRVDTIPDYGYMIIVSSAALVANAICLYLLQKNKSKDAHMRASMIFTSNDVVINAGVIIAGVLVNLLHSNYPDLIIGAVVFVIVVRGAYRIWGLAKS